ncbi:CRAL/TRIO domain-containing protein, partial [Aureobasidium melanogenum]
MASQSSSKAPSISSKAPSLSAGPEAVTDPAPTGPIKTPLTVALPECKPTPPAALTADQETKYASVLSTVSTWTTIPSSTLKDATNEPITDNERMWLTRECLLRYLRATKWDVPSALKRLQGTLSWRREYGADTFTADYISPENETGKQVIIGYDINARPCLYLNPGRQNTKNSDRQIHHLSFMLDRVIDMMGPGQETTALLINFKGAASGSTPTVSQARQVLNILQNHNPERLGRALISQLPWYVSTFFKLISPFIDPVTKEKMKFNEDLKKYVPTKQLWKDYGGELNFDYDHNAYWPALNKECDRRREAYKQRWVDAGKKIGEYEDYLRGGEQKCLRDLSGGVEKESAGVKVTDETPDIASLKV